MKTQDYLTRGCIDWQPLTPVDCVDKWSSLRPDSTALLDLVDGEVGIEVSWRALRQRVDALARRLKFAGLQLGDHVAIWMPNGMRWIEASLAVHAAGGVDVPLDIRLRREQCLAFARTTHCRWIVRQVGRQVVWQRIELGPSRSSSQRIQIEDACSNNHCLDDRFEVAYDVIASADDPEKYGVPAADGLTDDAEEMDCFVQVATLDPRRLASIQWTSGTTGAPKGVMLSHYNLLSNACGKWLAVPQQPTDVRITVLSLAHAYARTSDLGTWLVSGSTLAAVNSAEELIEIAPRVQPHLLNTVPYVIRRALGVARGRSIRAALGARLRWLGCGGAALDPAIFAKLKSDGIEVIQGYGLTETSPVICSAQPGSTEPGSVGPPIAGVEVRIDDNQEVWCRGPAVMIGYWQDDQATCQRVHDGWLHTGDVGSWSPSGQLRVHGRRDDVITLSTGHKVTPQQIELALMQRDEFEHVIVAGQGHSGLTALIYVRDTTLNGDEAKCLAICAAVLRDALWYEQIKRVEFLPHRLSEENGELTVKGTPRRNVVLERYYRG